MCSGGESISFSKLTSISKLTNIVNCGNGQTTRRPMWREPDMRNETNPCADADICHELSPDDNNTVSSDIYNLSPEVFHFRRRYSSNFLFAHVNINSFRHKYPFIHDMLIKQSVDLLAISESKLDHSFTDSQFQVTDYAIYRQDLTSSSGGLFERTYPIGDWGNQKSTVRVSSLYAWKSQLAKQKQLSVVYTNIQKSKTTILRNVFQMFVILYYNRMMI